MSNLGLRPVVIGAILTACGSGDSVGMDAHDEPDVDAAIIDPRTGMVLIVESQAFGISIAGAEFHESASSGTTLGTSGPCTASTATPSGSPSVSAGSVSITGTASPVTLVPSGTRPSVDYAPVGLPTPPFTAGASITVSAPGTADFPAFSAIAIAPMSLSGFAPPTSVSRAGYTATWAASTSPQITIVVSAKNAPYDSLRCTVPDTGSFTIPAAAFALLPSSDTMVKVSLLREGEVSVPAQNVRFSVASSNGNISDIPLN